MITRAGGGSTLPADPIHIVSLRVLVVEDDAEDFALTRRALDRLAAFRCEVRWAPTYAAATAALRGEEIDLVVLDQYLGSRTGLELLAEVFGSRPPVPVVLLTGHADGEIDARASGAGVATLLEKSELGTGALERSVHYALRRCRTERDLESARAFFHAGFDALQEHVAIVDDAGTIVEVNAAWVRFARENGGPDAGAWRGANYFAVCEAAVGEPRDGAIGAADGIREVLAGRRTAFRLEYPCHAPEAERWFALHAVRFEAAGRVLAYVAHHDVTERHLADRARRASEVRYRQLVETSHEGICTVDATGNITYANGRLSELLGYALPEILGRSIFAFMDPEAAFGARTRFARRQRGISEVEELPFRRRDGAMVWTQKAASSLKAAAGPVPGAVFRLTAITERRAAQQRLAASERLFRALTENSSDLVTIMAADGTIRYANPALARAYGLAHEVVIGRHVTSFVHPDDAPRIGEAFRQLVGEPGAVTTVEYRARHGDGTWRYRRAVAENLLHDEAVAGVVVNSQDVTEQRQAEETLRENERRYRMLFQRNPLPMYVADAATRQFLAVNDAAVAHYGYSREEFLAMRLDDISPSADRTAVVGAGAAAGGDSQPGVVRHLRKDGSPVDVEIVSDDVIFGDRSARLMLANDVTERRRAEAALRDAHRAMATLVDASPMAIVTLDDGGVVGSWNATAERMFGWTAAEVLGRESVLTVPGLGAVYERCREATRQDAGGGVTALETRCLRKDGAPIDVAISTSPLRQADGSVSGTVALIADITTRRAAESALGEARRQTELLLASTAEGIYALDADGRVTFANPAAARLVGSTPERLLGQQAHALLHHSHADGTPCDLAGCRINASIQDGTVHRVDTDVFWREDGTSFPVEYVSTPIREDGRITGAVVAFQDITQRRHLEMQLRQAQKMEAVGRLAGGVAHDFNNMLTVITGYAAMLLAEVPPEDPVRADLSEIMAASDRAAALTRQLLAFSRQQVLQPSVVELRQVVGNMEKMLRRLIGEDIEFTLRDDGEVAHVHADPGQIEQVVMNLAVNARDAMPAGGRLSIEIGAATLTAEDVARHPYVVAGRYVHLCVHDTGVGMDDATQARIFEPFFTTKEPGKGTGLGLATVYGIVKQSGGYIWVESAPGRGTTFRIYLPIVAEQAERADVEPAVALPEERRGATVLIAEDEDALRAMMQRVLRKRGYTVVTAANGEEALSAAERHGGRIDVLVTDVVMPRMSGQEVAERLSVRQGELQVLFLTGYSMEAVANHGVLRQGARLLKKPFTPHDLALAVSEVFHAPAGVRATGEHRAIGAAGRRER